MANRRWSGLFLPRLMWHGVSCSQFFLLSSEGQAGGIDYSYPHASEECIHADTLSDTIQT